MAHLTSRALAAALLCLAVFSAAASSDPLVDVLPDGAFGIGYSYSRMRPFYRGSERNLDHALLYLYEGDTFYLHGSRLGLKVAWDAWRFDTFVRHRFEGFTQDAVPSSALGMAPREPDLDAGISLRRKLPWGTPYAELTRDVSSRSEGLELKLGYWNEWRRGRLTLRPHAALSFRDSDLNDYYYGVRAAEATPTRPAYTAKGGMDGELGLYATYRLADAWHLTGSVTAGRRSSTVRASPIAEDRFDTAVTLGVLYDFSPQAKLRPPEGPPLIVRALYGRSSDCDMLQIVRLTCTSTHTVDDTDIFGVDIGRKLVRRVFDWPLDIGGFVGVLRHREKRFGDDFWQVHGYLKAWFYGFPWDRYVRTRIGFGGGLSWTEHISAMERRDQALHGRGNWKLLNYLDPTIDVSVGDLLRSPSLKETYVGMGVSHRSGMFGKSQLFGDITGGSNYIYGYLEHSF